MTIPTLPEKKDALQGMEKLVATVQKLSLAQDLNTVMKIVRTVARELTGADGATFVLRDEDKCYYADEDAIAPLWKGNRFPMSACISGWVMLNKMPVVISDIYADDRVPVDAYRPTFVKSLTMVPIRTIDPIGAIGNYWANHHTPTDEEVALLQALADITAVSIENINVRNTLEKKVNERTQELTDSLAREKELNELKSAFVSMASHEFRTPLSIIMMNTSLAEKYTDELKNKREVCLERIKNSVNNLVNLLNDFLSLDKLEQGKMDAIHDDINLKDFLQEISEGFDGIRKENQEIHFVYKGTEHVVIDKKLLQNIMLNLLSNAIKYSEKDIYLHAKVLNDQITLSVKDTGIGIPEEQQQQMFSKFFRANNTRNIQGTGLGLNIVQQYVSLLDGSINFTSKEDEGTTFTVLLPVKQLD